MSNTTKNIPYYLVAAGIFILLKIGFIFTDNNDLMFLLEPTDKLVGLLTGSQSIYLVDHGFFYEKMNILIEKSCSGFTFFSLCFLLFAYLGLKHFEKYLHKIAIFPIALCCAYLLTVFANVSRIVTSILVRNHTIGIFPDNQATVHEIVGITTYFTFLVLIYFLIEQLLKHIRYHAKST